jgi:lipoprotein-anchoring transpeptidase ErfK/SrfK
MKGRPLLTSLLALALWTTVAGPAAARERLLPAPSARSAWTARVVSPTAARPQPWVSHPVAHLATRAQWGGGPVQLLVLDSMLVRDPKPGSARRLWLKVALPIRPNGTTGWIRADKVTLSKTHWRVVVSRSRRQATVFHGGRVVHRMRVVVGAPATPTPLGRFAVYESIQQADPNGFIGPWALHLTAFSNVLDNYGGGPGRVALHGRGGASLLDPLGTARSHGCVRMRNSDIRYLARRIGPGTPVRIVR